MRQLASKKTAEQTRKGGMKKKDAKPALMDQQKLEEKLSRPVTSLKLSGLHAPIGMRALNQLVKEKVKTLGDLVKKSEEELSQTKFFGGEKTMKALKRSLKRLGLELGMEMPKKKKKPAQAKKKAAPKKAPEKKPEQKKAAPKKAPEKPAEPEKKPVDAQKSAQAQEKPAEPKVEMRPTVREGVTVEVGMGMVALENVVSGAKAELDHLLKTVRPELVKRLEQVVDLFRFPKRPSGRTGEANPGASF